MDTDWPLSLGFFPTAELFDSTFDVHSRRTRQLRTAKQAAVIFKV